MSLFDLRLNSLVKAPVAQRAVPVLVVANLLNQALEVVLMSALVHYYVVESRVLQELLAKRLLLL